MSENFRTALVTAAAVLLGGLIAGGASVVTTVVNQHGETERVERLRDEEARGAARVLLSRFTIVLRHAQTSLEEESFLEVPAELFVAPLARQDLKLISGRLAPDDFRIVNEVLQDVSGYLFVAKAGGDHVGPGLTPFERNYLRKLISNVKLGRTALLRIADLPRPSPSATASAYGSGT